MERFIARENIKRFRAQLSSNPDERTKETLEKLIAAEEARLREIGPE
jgi:hypothetical protein